MLMGKGGCDSAAFLDGQSADSGLVTIFWLVIVLVNAWTVKFFGEVEVVSSTIKFGWRFIVVISLIGLTLSVSTMQP